MFPPNLNQRIQLLASQASSHWRAQPAMFLAVVSSLDSSLFDRSVNQRRAEVYITPEFTERFEKALQTGDYVHYLENELRAMMVLDPLAEPDNDEGASSFKPKRIRDAFHKTPYHGGHAQQFKHYLSDCARRFSGTQGAEQNFTIGKGYFGKFVSICQTSGCGKTRMLHELGKTGVFSLYINLHGKDAREDIYPSRDNIPARILVDEAEPTQEQYTTRARAFFGSIFLTFKDWLLDCSEGARTLQKWEETMLVGEQSTSTRKAFFQGVSKHFAQLQTATNEIDALLDPFTSLTKTFAHVLKGEEPVFIIILDQADCLHSGLHPFSLSDVLCKVISAYSCRFPHIPVWVVFSSTRPTVGDYTEMAHESTSRIAQAGEKLFPPFSDLGWDHHARRLDRTAPLDSDKLASVDYLCRFGRPLWGALIDNTPLTALELVAEDRLCGSRTFDPWNEPDRVLAVLGQRFALDILPGRPHSIPMIETGMVHHMRYLHWIANDRRWRETGYPSEPFLSHVAAGLLALRCHDEPSLAHWKRGELIYTIKLVPALRMLACLIREGIVDKCQSGELISRVLSLSCKDLVIRETYLPPPLKKLGHAGREGKVVVFSMELDPPPLQEQVASSLASRKPYVKDSQLVYCREIPLLAFLGTLLGQRFWPSDADERNALARDFADAQINFSHWIKVKDNHAPKLSGEPIPADEWNRRLYCRTAAAQFSSQPGGATQAIPIYFERANAFSTLLVSVRLGTPSKGPADTALLDAARADLALDSPLPCVALALNFGAEDADGFVARYEDRCLRVYAPGLDVAAFPFIRQWPNMEAAVQLLAEEALRGEWRGPAMWGASSEREDMLWGEERCDAGV
ncbi:hypothetical protein BC834DRAFT_851780 [Gloeopeniophorella convolvens]|nr:hypothetical protein BC834DRAFT_851780 [Gloeopeniophorella convolvens]